jgi:hypothetical protein
MKPFYDYPHLLIRPKRSAIIQHGDIKQMKGSIKNRKVKGIVAIAAVLVGSNIEAVAFGRQIQDSITATGGTTISTPNLNRLSASSKMNLLLGKEFTVTKMGIVFKDRDRAAMNAAAVDLMYLIESLGDAPEAKELNAILKGILHFEKNGVETAMQIDKVFEKYSARQRKDDGWHARLGAASASLVYSAYYEDEASLRKDIATINDLLKIAPPSVQAELTNSLKSMSENIGEESLTTETMERITQMGLELFKSIEKG